MKYILILFCFIVGLQKYVSAQKKSGWLLYWHDKIIWLEDSFNKNVNDSTFFKRNANYLDGLDISTDVNANYYKQISIGKQIYYYRSTVIGNKVYDLIQLLPVKVKIYKHKDTTNFYKSDKLLINYKDYEIYIEYRGSANYSIIKVRLYRRLDKRALREIKKMI